MATVRLHEFTPRESAGGALVGFAAVRIDFGDGVALDITDIAVLRRDGRTWVSWPAKPQLGRDGVALRGENDKIKYSPPLVRPVGRDLAARLEAAIVAAVERAHPELSGDLFDARHAPAEVAP